MKIAIGCDSAGYELKSVIKKYLEKKGCEIDDVGMLDESDIKTYYDVAKNVAGKIQQREVERGILFCGTGMGVAIVANKFKGIYAAVVEGSYTSKMCASINNANILTMGGWIVGPEQAMDMVDRWLDTEFTEGFDDSISDFLKQAINEIKKIEEKNFM